MPIPVTCLTCGARLNAPQEAAGKTVRCPRCEAILSVVVEVAEAGSQTASTPAIKSSWSEPPPARATKACDFCGEEILVIARKCKHRGETLDPALRTAEEAKRLAVRSSGSAAAASTVVIHKGTEYRFPHLLHLFLTLVTCGIWLPLWIIHWILHEAFG
jgi:hypothetical protein